MGTAAEDTDYRHESGLDKALYQRLLAGLRLQEKQKGPLTGPTDVGKTSLACALAHPDCRMGRSAYYVRLARLLDELSIGRADGRYMKLLKQLAKIDVLVIDDWGLAVLDDAHRRDLLEVLDDRHGSGSTIVTSQLPIEHWHATIGDATLADAILDRLVHNAHQLNLKGDSLRKKRVGLTSTARPE
ncbi:ATP-binding protein [Janthinobacterium sp. ROICE36]|uniref:ATP-binding protein n=1 Tax=Janthinobacterium sp. ROICE36 TaxID=2048670 RepID=UPI00268D04CF|nr:ATP-binding protein [Janthinobacterium sp. ROICE36]